MQTVTLLEAKTGQEYLIHDIQTGDGELDTFLSSLGCCPGEEITLSSRRKSGCLVFLKDARYHIDRRLAGAIRVIAFS